MLHTSEAASSAWHASSSLAESAGARNRQYYVATAAVAVVGEEEAEVPEAATF